MNVLDSTSLEKFAFANIHFFHKKTTAFGVQLTTCFQDVDFVNNKNIKCYLIAGKIVYISEKIQ